MRDWVSRQYNDIKGNAKYSLLIALWWAVTWLGKKVLSHIPNIPNWTVWAILLLLSAVAFIWIAKSIGKVRPFQQEARPQVGISLPPVSALQSSSPPVPFDATAFFRTAYYSPVTAEVEKNIKIAAASNQPNDHEGFLAKFIGVGAVAYWNDITWAYIYKSQFLALTEMNRRNGWLPIAEAKGFYDRATKEYPQVYTNYLFDQWLEYMKTRNLVLRHPSDMLEITHGGKDLLRYVAHCGYNIESKIG